MAPDNINSHLVSFSSGRGASGSGCVVVSASGIEIGVPCSL
jgi:hypothetical protein